MTCRKCGQETIIKCKRGRRGCRGPTGYTGQTGPTGSSTGSIGPTGASFTGPTGASFTGPTGPTGAISDPLTVNNLIVNQSAFFGGSGIFLSTTGATASSLNYYTTLVNSTSLDWGTDNISADISITRIGNVVTVSVPVLTLAGPNTDKILSSASITNNLTLSPNTYLVTTTTYIADGGPSRAIARCFIGNVSGGPADISISSDTDGDITATTQLVVDPFSFVYHPQQE